MRVLHPVTQRETLIASGTYKYTRAGEPLMGEEHFSVHALPDGSWFVRIDYDWRMLDGTSQLIEALLDPQDSGGRFQRIVAQLHSPNGIVKESMDFYDERVLIGVSGADGMRRDLDLPINAGYVVLLLKTTLAGIAAARWPHRDGRPVTAFGGYRSSDDKALTFDAALTEVRDDVIAAGAHNIRTRVVELTGEFTQTLWLDQTAGIAIRRVTGELVADVTNYARGAGKIT